MIHRSTPIDRRTFLLSGGAAALGLALPSGTLAAIPRTSRGPRIVRMWSDPTGAAVGFDPVGLAVAPGDEVRWVLDSGAHSTTAYHASLHAHPTRIPPGARPWDSGILFRPGATFEIALEVPGVYDVYCLPHEAAGMVGRIVAGEPGVDFEVPPYGRTVGRYDGPLPPDAALAAFPAVETIVREGTVPHPDRTEPPKGDSR